MNLRFYNTLTRKKEYFKPLKKGEVKVYSCGPTVYSTQHIGNMRAAIFADVLKRVLRYFEYRVIDVVNITDVGHLVSDENEGEDKMLKASKKENKDPYEIAKYYEEQYLNDLEKLHIIKPKYLPRATEHIKEQIDMIKHLEERGFTYKTSDGIYFDVSKFKHYGKLSGQKIEDKKAGARVDVNSEKRNPQDFALWKFLTGDNKNHIMKWESPWGQGFPGWHIECSAMSRKYLGHKFDIHTGGIDHVPIHHENEIAQNECSGDVKEVKFWMHNEHLTGKTEKFSKSLGNAYSIQDLIDKGYSPIAFREFILRSHYRKQTQFELSMLDASEKTIQKINDFYSRLDSIKSSNVKASVKEIYDIQLDEFEKALKDDLNTPESLASVHEFMNEFNKLEKMSNEDIELAKDFMKKTDSVLGLLEKQENVPLEIIKLAENRVKARDKKDWTLSDKIRNEILEKGYEIKDDKASKTGYIITKK